jgi:hypothetical protein
MTNLLKYQNMSEKNRSENVSYGNKRWGRRSKPKSSRPEPLPGYVSKENGNKKSKDNSGK